MLAVLEDGQQSRCPLVRSARQHDVECHHVGLVETLEFLSANRGRLPHGYGVGRGEPLASRRGLGDEDPVDAEALSNERRVLSRASYRASNHDNQTHTDGQGPRAPATRGSSN